MKMVLIYKAHDNHSKTENVSNHRCRTLIRKPEKCVCCVRSVAFS